MLDLALVAAGGFLGAISRYNISKILNKKYSFIYLGTFLINISGSLLLGFLVNIHLNTNINLFMGIGFLGAFTTFSTFKVESLSLVHSKQSKQFLIYFFLTYTIGIIFALIGFWFGKELLA